MIPVGELVTVPLPLPPFMTFRVYVSRVNMAVTIQSDVIGPVV